MSLRIGLLGGVSFDESESQTEKLFNDTLREGYASAIESAALLLVERLGDIGDRTVNMTPSL